MRTPFRGGNLWSAQKAENFMAALRQIGEVWPFDGLGPDQEIAAVLQEADILWADLYPWTTRCLEQRRQNQDRCRAVLFAGGTLPKAAEAMLFPWRKLLRPDDGIVFTSDADRTIWRRLNS
jgi:hypothetical protein